MVRPRSESVDSSTSDFSNTSSESLPEEALSALRELLKLPALTSNVNNAARNLCIRLNISVEQYDGYFRDPQLLIEDLEDKVKAQARQIRRLKAEKKAEKEQSSKNKGKEKAMEQETIEQYVSLIKRLKARKVNDPETYAESLVYLGVDKDTAMDEIRKVAQKALRDAQSRWQEPMAAVERAYLLIANARGIEDMSIFPDKEEFDMKKERKPYINPSVKPFIEGCNGDGEVEADNECDDDDLIMCVKTPVEDCNGDGEADGDDEGIDDDLVMSGVDENGHNETLNRMTAPLLRRDSSIERIFFRGHTF